MAPCGWNSTWVDVTSSLTRPPNSWFYAKDFVQCIKLNIPAEFLDDMEDSIVCDWSDATAEFKQKYALRAVVPASTVPIRELRSLDYYDGGSLSEFALSSQIVLH